MTELDLTTQLAPILWGMLALLVISGGAIAVAAVKSELGQWLAGRKVGRVRFAPARRSPSRCSHLGHSNAAGC